MSPGQGAICLSIYFFFQKLKKYLRNVQVQLDFTVASIPPEQGYWDIGYRFLSVTSIVPYAYISIGKVQTCTASSAAASSIITSMFCALL